ncbi:MAG: hypothetical protein AMJ68_02740 [Acidithiobacillales bacterium SG8_45]|nr:MAG: hypothetical protein AMJ68_02740 [Acidithiobacillales bacterium SG8_45]
MRSLQSKLGSGLALTLFAVFSVLWLLVSFSIQYLAEDYIASRLGHDAEMLLSAVHFDNPGNPNLNDTTIDPVYGKPFSGHYYAITSGNKVMSSRSLWDQRLSGALVKPGEHVRDYQDGPESQSLLVISYGFIKQDHSLIITVAEDMNPVKGSIRQFQFRFAIAAAVMLALLVMLQVLILRNGLGPLSVIRGELKSLQQGESTHLDADAPAELRPLVNEINHLLQVTEQRLRRSRDSLGDLAHSIKRPLTILQQLTDKNRDVLPVDINEVLARQVVEISRLTDRILKRARIAGHGHSSARFSFSRDMPQLIETLDMMYSEKSVVTQVELPEAANCPIDREDMLELLGNLLDNAYKWASRKVVLRISMNAELAVCVEDDGPGADPDQLEQLDKRGVRLDETKQGYGFGLSIASDLVREYGGTLSFGRSVKLGGFRIDVTLPVDEVFTDPGNG